MNRQKCGMRVRRIGEWEYDNGMSSPKTSGNVRVWCWLSIMTSVVCVGIFAIHELLRLPQGDAYIFLAVGRGIMNGLRPYVDLFESKPPGIFILAAIASKTSNPLRAVEAIVATVAIALPIFMVGHYCYDEKKLRRSLLPAFSAMLSLCGLAVVLLLQQTGGFLPAYFALGSILLYCFLLFRGKISWVAACFFGVLVCLIALFREPAILGLVAAMVMMISDRRQFLWFGVIPVVFGIVFWTGCISIIGWDGYTSYLRDILHTRTSGGNILLLSLNPIRFAETIWTAPLAQLFFMGTGIHWIFRYEKDDRRRMTIIMRMLVALFLCNLASKFGAERYSIGYSEYFLPFVFSLMFLSLKGRMLQAPGIAEWSAVLIFCSILVLVPFETLFSRSQQTLDPETLAVAQSLDSIMDECGIAQWMHIGPNTPIYGLTKHSPVGPLFIMDMYFLRDRDLIKSLPQIAQKADIILRRKNATYTIEEGKRAYYFQMQKIMDDHFTDSPWDCASQTIDSEHYLLAWRRKP